MSELNQAPWLHIYGQYTYHSDAVIRGTPEGLAALRDAIDAALEARDGEAAVFAADGEGYLVKVNRVNVLASLGAPQYIEEVERPHRRLMPVFRASEK